MTVLRVVLLRKQRRVCVRSMSYACCMVAETVGLFIHALRVGRGEMARHLHVGYHFHEGDGGGVCVVGVRVGASVLCACRSAAVALERP